MSNKFDIVKIETNKSKIPQRSVMKKGIIPQHPSVVIFSGGVGSGKSNLLINLLSRDCFYGKKEINGNKIPCYFNEIYIFSPTCFSDDLYDSLDIPHENKFDNPDPDDLRKIIDKQKKLLQTQDIHEIPRILFIFDDIQTRQKFLRSKEFREVIFANRHISASSFVLGQSWTKTPRDVRCQISNLFFFQGNSSEHNLIADEFSVMGLTRSEMNNIIEYCTNEKHSFLHINRKVSDPSLRFRKNLNGILKIKPKDERMNDTIKK